ncbi:hypothetical protein BDW02DRAFT_110515 [Decorospora gaudefroyi]|uniref:Uncharacterized protein n=1 Tax=Decorospora gaudefroyi TaxID=184978 RepID=A0A6A5K6Z5_9PLEO|nr:hypothetical protein BDW02DRAFT_110515 [Decorospora gaudefroyi]
MAVSLAPRQANLTIAELLRFGFLPLPVCRLPCEHAFVRPESSKQLLHTRLPGPSRHRLSLATVSWICGTLFWKLIWYYVPYAIWRKRRDLAVATIRSEMMLREMCWTTLCAPGTLSNDGKCALPNCFAWSISDASNCATLSKGKGRNRKVSEGLGMRYKGGMYKHHRDKNTTIRFIYVSHLLQCYFSQSFPFFSSI